MDASRARILIVDDEPEIQELIQRTLEREGYSIQTVGSAGEARQVAAKTQFHVLLVDLSLPDGTGIDLVKELCVPKGTPAGIIITGYPSVNSVTEAMKLSARNYLSKPVSPSDVVEAVRTVLTEEGVLISSEEVFLKELGKRLRAARQKHDLTMKMLGDRIGISQAQISQIEAGLSAPSLTTLYRLTKAVRTPMSEILADL